MQPGLSPVTWRDRVARFLKQSAAPEAPCQPVSAVEPRTLALNFVYLTVGECTAKLLTFAAFSYLARTLGPAPYGMLEFTLALMTYFTLAPDLGLSYYGAREIARHPERAPRLLHEITGLKVALTLVSMAALGIFILVIHQSAALKGLLALYGVSLLAGPFLLQWFFQAHDRMIWVGLTSIVRQASIAALIFLLCRRGSSVLVVGLCECASVAASAAFCIWVTRRKLGCPWPWPDLHIRRLLGHLREAAPIGLNEIAWAFQVYFCTVLLGFVDPGRALGWFGASHRAVMALHTFVYLYFFNLLPSISRCAALPHSHLLGMMDGSIRLMAWSGLFVAGVSAAVAPQLMPLVYGSQYREAAQSFALLVWILPIAMLSGHHRYVLIAYNRQDRLLACTIFSAIATAVAGFLLIPREGGPGAAWALLIGMALNFVLVYVSVKQLIAEIPIHRQLAAPLMALAASAGLFWVLAGTNFWMALAGGAAIYCAMLAWTDGRHLQAFTRTMLRGRSARPATAP